MLCAWRRHPPPLLALLHSPPHHSACCPLPTAPFALLQGWVFSRTGSLLYVLIVHLLFDVIVFLAIVHAHNPGAIPIFLI